MSGNKKKNDEGGLGLGTAFLVAAGAGAVGFLARDLWNSYQEASSSQARGQTSGAPPVYRRPSSAWEDKQDKNLGLRKKQREIFKEQNVPDEMKCVVCIDNPREICLVPCGHVCLCEDCAEKIDKKCPMCQAEIRNKKVIYL